MDFTSDPAVDARLQHMREAAAELADLPAPEPEGFYTREQWRHCGKAGLLGLSLPRDYGGQGLDALTSARCVEAFGHVCEATGLVFAASAHLFACATPIHAHASEEVKTRVLPALCSGEAVGANAITEWEAGSDVGALRTTAERDGDVYVLNGTKSFVSNGPAADVFVVYATVDPALGPLGITGFVVERDQPGVAVGEPLAKMGLASCPASEVYFEDCRVPAVNRLGSEGQGGQIFQASMQWERACLFAGYLGLMDRLLDRCIEHARTRRQHGRAIGRNQAVSHRIVDMKVRLDAARLLLYRACWGMDNGGSAMDVSISKLAVSEAVVQTSLEAIQLFGSLGYLVDAGIERALRDAVPSTIFSGTSEMQRELIARELGL